MNISNFNEHNELLFENEILNQQKVNIRKNQRNGRKCTTIIEGLENDLDIKKITKALKRFFKCNGSVEKDKDNNEIIQLSGDQRDNVLEFLIDQEIVEKENIIIH